MTMPASLRRWVDKRMQALQTMPTPLTEAALARNPLFATASAIQ
jgi:hypothetical protein